MYRLNDFSGDREETKEAVLLPARPQEKPHAPARGRPRGKMGALLEAFCEDADSLTEWLAKRGMIEWM